MSLEENGGEEVDENKEPNFSINGDPLSTGNNDDLATVITPEKRSTTRKSRVFEVLCIKILIFQKFLERWGGRRGRRGNVYPTD